MVGNSEFKFVQSDEVVDECNTVGCYGYVPTTQTASFTPTNTQTPTHTSTETPTQTPTPTITKTSTQTPTVSNTPTNTAAITYKTVYARLDCSGYGDDFIPYNIPDDGINYQSIYYAFNCWTIFNGNAPFNEFGIQVGFENLYLDSESCGSVNATTPCPTVTASFTPSPTSSITKTPTPTQTPTPTPTPTLIATPTPTPTLSETPTPTPTSTVVQQVNCWQIEPCSGLNDVFAPQANNCIGGNLVQPSVSYNVGDIVQFIDTGTCGNSATTYCGEIIGTSLAVPSAYISRHTPASNCTDPIACAN